MQGFKGETEVLDRLVYLSTKLRVLSLFMLMLCRKNGLEGVNSQDTTTMLRIWCFLLHCASHYYLVFAGHFLHGS